jgi:hypothetical protein
MIARLTGLPERSLRKVIRSYGLEVRGKPVRRKTGKSFQQVGFFFQSKNRKEAAALAALCVAMKAVPREPMRYDVKGLPGLYYGERLCAVHEFFRQQVPEARFPLERTISMVTLLGQGEQLRCASCVGCKAITLIEPGSLATPICCFCEEQSSKKYAKQIAAAVAGMLERGCDLKARGNAQFSLSFVSQALSWTKIGSDDDSP